MTIADKIYCPVCKSFDVTLLTKRNVESCERQLDDGTWEIVSEECLEIHPELFCCSHCNYQWERKQ